jgi:hypothetical protein
MNRKNRSVRFISAFLVLLFCIQLAACGKDEQVDNSIVCTELGIPLEERYSSGGRARCPSDMELYNGKLYVGSGDYNVNMGPVDIWCYDLETGSWQNSGTVQDEEVSRFCVINGELIAMGIDPKGTWEYGNYYKLVDGEWQTFRTLPNGVHNFDMVEYDGRLFAALGVGEGDFPIVCSADGGANFYPVSLFKNGEPIDTRGSDVVRVLDFIVFNSDLYAIYYYGEQDITYELYRFDGSVFVYEQNLLGKIFRKKISSHIIDAKVEFADKLYLATGYFYIIDDMNKIERISLPNSELVYDLYQDGKWLYLLCGEELEDGTYKVSVWRCGEKNDSAFEQIFDFVYEVPPLSLVVKNDDFYIGMGSISKAHEKNGMIIMVNT